MYNFEKSKEMKNIFTNKIILVINADGGGYYNHYFKRLIALRLFLTTKYNLEKIISMKTVHRRIYCNISERSMYPPSI